MSRLLNLSHNPRLIVTPGDPAGIGLDIVCELAQHEFDAEIVIIADKEALSARAKQLKLKLELLDFDRDQQHLHQRGKLVLAQQSLAKPCTAGKVSLANSQQTLTALQHATELCLAQRFDALVTGPINKAAINKSGIAFTGHTDFLRELCHVDLTLMLFVSDVLNVALATTHCPLRTVPDLISQESLQAQIQLLSQAIQRYFKTSGAIKVCGLNPHAGEDGHLGHEEVEIISPAIKACQQLGIDVSGPYAADTIFNNAATDVIFAMYHDQALPVIKALCFGKAVNVTLGLPFIRTSVDHGTGFDIAGTGKANANSLIEAIQLACRLHHVQA